MEINKDLLNNALSSIRRMSNDLKAYRHAEEVIETFVAAQASLGDLTALVAALQAEADGFVARRAEAEEAHRVRLAAMDDEAVAKKEALGAELFGIRKEIDDERGLSNRKISAFKENVATAEAASNEARQRHEGLLADLHNEIAVKTGIRDNLQAEIDALKQKFA